MYAFPPPDVLLYSVRTKRSIQGVGGRVSVLGFYRLTAHRVPGTHDRDDFCARSSLLDLRGQAVVLVIRHQLVLFVDLGGQADRFPIN